MTHPEDLLAGYVDATISPSDRRDLDAHLATCDRCRREVALAREARTALSTLAAAPVPADLADRALIESRRSTARGGPPTWYRWATGAAAAAAVLLLVGIVVPRLSDSASEDASGPAAGAQSGAAQAESDARSPRRIVEVRDRDYSTADVQHLALTARTQGIDGSFAAPVSVAPDSGAVSYSSRAEAARACLRSAYPPEDGEPLRLIDARFEDTPAYIGLFRDRSGADEPAGSVLVVVAAKRGCRVLSTTTAPG